MAVDGPDFDQSTLGNTNSSLYMWEPANPCERADFEEDLIASTNERLYQAPLACLRSKGVPEGRPLFLDECMVF